MLDGLRPFDDVVVVRRDDPETVTPGGIVLPPAAQADVDQGTIVARGPGKRGKVRIPMEVRDGERVLFSKYANLPFKWRGEEFVTMREADLIAVID